MQFMKQGDVNQDKMLNLSSIIHVLYITSISDITHQSFNLSLMFMIMIENLLHFLKYFDDKIISVNNFPLGIIKVLSTHLSFCVLYKCGKILKRENCANILCHLESCHVASNSSLFWVSSFIECYRRCVNGSRLIVQQ